MTTRRAQHYYPRIFHESDGDVPFNLLLKLVAPKATSRELAAIFCVPHVKIWEWRTGRRAPSAFACEIIQSMAANYSAAIETNVAGIKPGPGRASSRRNLMAWRAAQNLS